MKIKIIDLVFFKTDFSSLDFLTLCNMYKSLLEELYFCPNCGKSFEKREFQIFYGVCRKCLKKSNDIIYNKLDVPELNVLEDFITLKDLYAFKEDSFVFKTLN